MSKNNAIPNAWDDDYESVIAQQTTVGAVSQAGPQPRITRAERKAKHVADNKQLWDSAENPETFHFVETRKAAVPLTSEFKPALQVLSRKPKPPTTTALASGLNGLTLGDDGDDSEEEARKSAEKLLAERQLRAKHEREEKQRKYAEARARLFGPESSGITDSNAGRAPSPAGSVSAHTNARAAQPRRGSRRAGAGPGGRDSHSASSADQSPARGAAPVRQLYDPDLKPGSVFIQKRGGAASGGSSRATSPSHSNSQTIRLPKGPDGSGRGGFGFAARGNRTGNVG